MERGGSDEGLQDMVDADGCMDAGKTMEVQRRDDPEMVVEGWRMFVGELLARDKAPACCGHDRPDRCLCCGTRSVGFGITDRDKPPLLTSLKVYLDH